MKQCLNCGSSQIVSCTLDDYPDAVCKTCLNCSSDFIKTEPDGEWLNADDVRRCNVCGLYYDAEDFQAVSWGNPGEEACSSCATGVGEGK